MADNKENFIADCIRFWSDENHTVPTARESKDERGNLGVQLDWKYNDKVKNKKLRSTISGVFQEYPEKWGRGEWIAKNIEDARQMACDFATGVS